MHSWMKKRIEMGRKLLECVSAEPQGAFDLAAMVGEPDEIPLVSSILRALAKNGEVECFHCYGCYWYVTKGTDVSKFF